MLKRAAAVLLSILVPGYGNGLCAQRAFLRDSITAVSINATAKAPAGCADGMPCCANKHMVVKVRDAHLAQVHNLQAKLPALTVAPLVHPYFFFSFNPVLSETFINKRPPDPHLQGVDAFLKNQVFRI